VNVKEDATSSRCELFSISDPDTDSLDGDEYDEEVEGESTKLDENNDEDEWNLSEFFLSKAFENLELDVELKTTPIKEKYNKMNRNVSKLRLLKQVWMNFLCEYGDIFILFDFVIENEMLFVELMSLLLPVDDLSGFFFLFFTTRSLWSKLLWSGVDELFCKYILL